MGCKAVLILWMCLFVVADAVDVAGPGLMRHELEVDSLVELESGVHIELHDKQFPGICADWTCKHGVHKNIPHAPCVDEDSCSWNCCEVDLKSDSEQLVGTLTYASLLAMQNLSGVYTEMTHKDRIAADTEFLQQKTEGLFNVMRKVNDDNRICPHGKVQYTRTCLNMALCLIESLTDSSDQEGMRAFTMLTEQYARFDDIAWERMIGADMSSPVETTIKSHSVDPTELQCEGVAEFVGPSLAKSLVQTASQETSDLEQETDVMRASAMLLDVAETTHEVLDSHSHNSSVDQTVASLHETWKPACELLQCDHTNYWDLLGASHSHSLALLETGASATHMKELVRTRARLENRVQMFMGTHGKDFHDRIYRLEGSQTEAKLQQYGATTADALQNRMKNHVQKHGISSSLLGLVTKQELNEHLNRSSPVINALRNNRLLIVPDKEALEILTSDAESFRSLLADLGETKWDWLKNLWNDHIKDHAVTAKDWVVATYKDAKAAIGDFLLPALRDFLTGFFKCVGVALTGGIGYGKRFLLGGPKGAGYKGVMIGFSLTSGANLKSLILDGEAVMGIKIAINFVAGIIPGNGVTGGVRIGLGVAAGVTCTLSGNQKKCIAEVGVGFLASAVVPGSQNSPTCPFGPEIGKGTGITCGMSFGVTVKLLCCNINILTGEQSCTNDEKTDDWSQEDYLEAAKRSSQATDDIFEVTGNGNCNSGQVYSSGAWNLQPEDLGKKEFGTQEYKEWVLEAWSICLQKDANTKHVSVWKDAGFRCYTDCKCSLENTGSTGHQTWTFKTGGWSEIKMVHGKCLDANRNWRNRNSDGVNAHIWNCIKKHDNQMWGWVYSYQQKARTGQIKNKHGKCLKVENFVDKGDRAGRRRHRRRRWSRRRRNGPMRDRNGARVQTSRCTLNDDQKWELDTCKSQLKMKSGKCLDSNRRNKSGGRVHLWSCNQNHPNQRWEMRQLVV